MRAQTLDSGNYNVSFQFLKPSNLMLDTRGIGKKLADNFESHLHDHLQIIVNELSIYYQNLILPKGFRTEWLVHVKSKSDYIGKAIDAWFRLIITLEVSETIEIQNYWFDKLSGESENQIDILLFINDHLHVLIEKSVTEFSEIIKYSEKTKRWSLIKA